MLFSLEVEPQVMENTQHTPKEEAQVPLKVGQESRVRLSEHLEEPPLAVHSELV